MADGFKLTMVRDFLEIPNAQFVKEWKKLDDPDKEEIKKLVAEEMGIEI